MAGFSNENLQDSEASFSQGSRVQESPWNFIQLMMSRRGGNWRFFLIVWMRATYYSLILKYHQNSLPLYFQFQLLTFQYLANYCLFNTLPSIIVFSIHCQLLTFNILPVVVFTIYCNCWGSFKSSKLFFEKIFPNAISSLWNYFISCKKSHEVSHNVKLKFLSFFSAEEFLTLMLTKKLQEVRDFWFLLKWNTLLRHLDVARWWVTF